MRRVRAWCRQNLTDYWVPMAHGWRALADVIPDEHLTDPYGLAWGVLGVPRLDFTVRTLDTTSKGGAGRWALANYGPEWHAVIEFALSVRLGRPIAMPMVPADMWHAAADSWTWS